MAVLISSALKFTEDIDELNKDKTYKEQLILSNPDYVRLIDGISRKAFKFSICMPILAAMLIKLYGLDYIIHSDKYAEYDHVIADYIKLKKTKIIANIYKNPSLLLDISLRAVNVWGHLLRLKPRIENYNETYKCDMKTLSIFNDKYILQPKMELKMLNAVFAVQMTTVFQMGMLQKYTNVHVPIIFVLIKNIRKNYNSFVRSYGIIL